MLLFTILHSYEIELSGAVLSDRPALGAGTRIGEETQRGCSAILAELWAGTGDPRADYMYWYHRWQDWGSYWRAERLTDEERARMRQMMRQMEEHPFVARFVPTDSDPAADPT